LVQLRIAYFKIHSYITISIAYFCAFGIILLVPVDVAMTITSRKQILTPGEQNPFEPGSKKLVKLYESLFWPTFVLGTIILTYQELYVENGNFTIATKLKDACKIQSKIWLLMLIAGCIFIGIIVGSGLVTGSSTAVQLTCIGLNNFFGLCVIICLMGYGLIEFIRSLWLIGNEGAGSSPSKASAAIR
jgi:hypothetical protein